MVDDDEKVMKKFRFSGVTYIKVDVSQGLTYRKGDVYELPDPAVYNHPPGVEQLVTRPVVEQLVRGRH